MEEVGPNTAAAIHEYFSHPRRRELIEALRRHGLRFEETRRAAPAAGPLSGKSVVITGALPDISREEASERLAAAGARISASISKKTDYLVVGESAGSKLEKARSLGVPTLTWPEMLRVLEKE